uniref:Scaffold attachment factor B2-like n=1 Tax=Hirondellea gigas TaxID=1518452 RepID=A0A6A7FU03_9CRUS
MGNTEEASKCIKLLNKTELHGRIILVEQAKGETAAGSAGNSSSHNKSGDSGSDGKRDKSGRRVDSRRRSADIKRGDKTEGRRSGGSSRERDRRARVIDHRYGAPRPMRGALGNRHSSGKEDRRSPSKTGDSRRVPIARRLSPRLGGGVVSPRRLSPLIDRRETLPRRHDKEMLGLTHIIEERERERLRARDRQMREEERRAREDEARQRMIERRQREEAERLHREREQLRAERERIERQKQELLRLEREQQRMEREKLEREREELRRQQIKLSHTDRVSKTIGSRYDQRGSRSLKRSATDDRGSGRAEAFYDDRKRPAHDRGAMPVDTRARYEDPLHSRTRYESSRDVHRYDSSSSSNIHTSYARDALVRESSSSSRYDRHSTGLPVTPTATASASKSSHSTDDLRWLSGAQPAPISNSRRSDGYYDDRRGDSRSSAVATTSDGRVLREYHHGAPAVLAPPAPLISSRSSDSSSRVSRDSGKGIYSSSMSSSDVWRTGSSSSKTSTYGSSSGSKSIYGSSGSKSMYGSTSSSSSSKNVYGSSAVSGSSSKGVYSGASNGTGGLLASHHEGGTWRGSVSNAGASSSSSGGRWSDTRNSSSNNNNNNNSGGGGGGGGSNGSASVKMADYARDTLINYNSSSSSSSHHPTLQTMQSAAQDTRDYALSSSSSYRKY